MRCWEHFHNLNCEPQCLNHETERINLETFFSLDLYLQTSLVTFFKYLLAYAVGLKMRVPLLCYHPVCVFCYSLNLMLRWLFQNIDNSKIVCMITPLILDNLTHNFQCKLAIWRKCWRSGVFRHTFIENDRYIHGNRLDHFP